MLERQNSPNIWKCFTWKKARLQKLQPSMLEYNPQECQNVLGVIFESVVGHQFFICENFIHVKILTEYLLCVFIKFTCFKGMGLGNK